MASARGNVSEVPEGLIPKLTMFSVLKSTIFTSKMALRGKAEPLYQ